MPVSAGPGGAATVGGAVGVDVGVGVGWVGGGEDERTAALGAAETRAEEDALDLPLLFPEQATAKQKTNEEAIRRADI